MINLFCLLIFVIAIMYSIIRHKGFIKKQEYMVNELAHLKELHRYHLETIVTETKEIEWKKMGQEIHDDFAGSIAGAILFIRLKAMEEQLPSDKQHMEFVAQTLEDSYERVRSKSHKLFFQKANNCSFQNLLYDIEKLFAANITSVDCTIQNPASLNLTDEVTHAVIMMLTECINNINKHAGATIIALLIYERYNSIHIVISDNGIGFQEKEAIKGIGINSLKRRAKQIGGTIKILSGIKGTTIKISFPFARII